MLADLGEGFAPGRARLSANLLSLDSRLVRSPVQRCFLFRDVEAPPALASPLKIPGCRGFFGSVAPVKFPDRGQFHCYRLCLREILSEDDGSSPVERVIFERSSLLGFCVELWRMRSCLQLILSEIRRTWEIGGRGEVGVEFMSSGVARGIVGWFSGDSRGGGDAASLSSSKTVCLFIGLNNSSAVKPSRNNHHQTTHCLSPSTGEEAPITVSGHKYEK
ncbi:hypothetical protein YC2023_109494 [Brassica napus]